MYKSGLFSHDQIDKLFSSLSSPDDLHNANLIAEKCVKLMNESLCGNSTTYGLVYSIVQFFIANSEDNTKQIIIKCTKKNGRWGFVIGRK